MIDDNQTWWIVDWESYSETGCFVWDLYFFYGNWKRDTSRAPNDIKSIVDSDGGCDVNIREMLLFYALIKLRSDLLRHNRIIDIALESFSKRIYAIIEIY